MVNKRPVFSWFLENSDVLVSIDTACDGVDTPPQLQTGEVVSFIFGAVPTPHLTFDDWGITSPMRFSGNLYTCRFPWEAIQQLSSQDAVIQFRNSDAPDEATTDAPSEKNPSDKGKKGRGNLRLVK